MFWRMQIFAVVSATPTLTNKACIQHFSSLIRKYCEKERIIRVSLQDLMATTNSTYVTFDMPSLKNKVKIQYYLTHSLMEKKGQ